MKEHEKNLMAKMTLCEGCPRMAPPCTAYSIEGMALRNRNGYCPLEGGRYADWRTDKPKEAAVKVRQGQQKQKKSK